MVWEEGGGFVRRSGIWGLKGLGGLLGLVCTGGALGVVGWIKFWWYDTFKGCWVSCGIFFWVKWWVFVAIFFGFKESSLCRCGDGGLVADLELFDVAVGVFEVS